MPKGTITLIFNNKTIRVYVDKDSYCSQLGESLRQELIYLFKTYSFDNIIAMLDKIKIGDSNCEGSIIKMIEQGCVLNHDKEEEYNYVIDFDRKTYSCYKNMFEFELSNYMKL